jgi:hypothetical protein
LSRFVKAILCLAAKDRAHAIDILERLIGGGRKAYRPIGHKARDTVLVGTADRAAWNDQPVASAALTASVQRRFYRFFQYARLDGALAARAVVQAAGARRQDLGSSHGSDKLRFWQDHDQHLMISVTGSAMGIPLR